MAYRIEQTGVELQGILNDAAVTKQGLEDEVARAQAAEGVLQENIDSEAGERQSADALLAGNIGTEVARAQQAESDLGVRVDANAAGVAAEVTRAQEAEGEVWDTLNDEILTRQSQDAALQGNIEREALLRENGDGHLQGEIDTISVKIPSNASENNKLVDAVSLDAKIGGKADRATTLAGYGIEDAYTKDAVDEMVETLSRNEVVVGALPQTGEEGLIYRVPGNGYYTDYMYYNGEFVELAQYSMEFDQTQVGYFTCDTAAGTAAKTVSAAGYTLAVGGNMRIKMTNANTAANVTMEINGAGAKALFYNGEQASATNSWKAGEVLEVYYDGTQYQCASVPSGQADASMLTDVELLMYELTWENGWYQRNGTKNTLSKGRNTAIDVRDCEQLVFKGSVGSSNNDIASVVTYSDNDGEIGDLLGVYNASEEGGLVTISLEGVGWVRYSVRSNLTYTPYIKIAGKKEPLSDAVAGIEQDIDDMKSGGSVKAHYHDWQDGTIYDIRSTAVGSVLPSPTSRSDSRMIVISVKEGEEFFFTGSPALSNSEMWTFVDESDVILSKGNTGYGLQVVSGVVAPPHASRLIICSKFFAWNTTDFVLEYEDPYRIDTVLGTEEVDIRMEELLKESNTVDVISTATAVLKAYTPDGEVVVDSSLETDRYSIVKSADSVSVTRTGNATITAGAVFFDISSLADGKVYTALFHCTHVPIADIDANYGKIGTMRMSANIYSIIDYVVCNTTSDGADFELTFVKTSNIERLGFNFGSISINDTIVINGFCVREYQGEVSGKSLEGIDSRLTALESYVTEQTKHARTVTRKDCFTVSVDIALPTFDTDAGVDGAPIPGTDYGFVTMPENYSPTGQPVRLVIFCHGVGAAKNTYTNNMTVVPAYASHWLRLGYAVMDMVGIPYELSGVASGEYSEQHYGCPVTLQCYKKGYEYVINNYNVKKDGVVVIGASMGGMSSFEIVQSGVFPVLCQIAYCPVIETFKQCWCRSWSTEVRERYARYFGFEGTAPAWTTNPYPSAEEIQYYKDNLDKVIGYFPMMNNIVKGDIERIFDVIPNISTTAYSEEEAAVYEEFIAYQPCPLKIFHNLNDPLVAPRYSQYYIGMAKRSGAIAEYRTFSTGEHVSWDNGDDVELTDINGDTFTVKTSKAEAYWFAKRFEF